MATFAEIRFGLVENLAPLGIQSKGYMLTSPSASSIEIFPGESTYDKAFARGLDEINFVVRIVVAISLDVAAQQKLDGYLDPSGSGSVKTLIESDKTLGGKIDNLRVTEATGFQVSVAPEGGQVLSCDWTVRIYA